VQLPTVPLSKYPLKIWLHFGAAAVPPLLEAPLLEAPLLEAPLEELGPPDELLLEVLLPEELPLVLLLPLEELLLVALPASCVAPELPLLDVLPPLLEPLPPVPELLPLLEPPPLEEDGPVSAPPASSSTDRFSTLPLSGGTMFAVPPYGPPRGSSAPPHPMATTEAVPTRIAAK
jgi:hypothetical protein